MINAAQCPLCKGENVCGMARNPSVESSCWCGKVELTNTQREALKSMNIEPSCLCISCLLKIKDEYK